MVATLLQRCHRSVVSNIPINALINLSRKPLLAAVSAGYDLQLFKHNNNRSTTSYLLHQTYSSTSYNQHKVSDGGSNTTDLHALYHDQMKEIQSERESIFGKESEDDPSNQSPDLSQTANSYFTSSNNSSTQSLQQPTEDTTTPQFRPPNWNAEEYEAAAAKRDALYDFSDEEKSAWSSNNGTETLSSLHMLKIREMIRQAPDETKVETSTTDTTQQTSQFSHLTPQGDGVSMVDVGHKVPSRRVATARSVVVFPPEVMSAFQVNDNEIVGHKGPIFETAKIAGIMGAKKTSDLIPLCHPLPLDRVNINIQLVHNQAIIECECRVTHKTGVEMEALTGASIAALTIYDMVKAVSHKVEIGQTILVNKSGGKSDYNNF